MDYQDHHPHMLHLPRFYTIVKYVQLIIAVLIIGLSAFGVYMIAFNAHAYAIFTGLYTIGIIIYFLVASKATPKSYNWIALLVLEVFAVLFWLAAWAALGALFAALAYIGAGYSNYDYYYAVKRGLESRSAYSYGLGYAGCLIAAIALSVINFLLYVLTLVYISRSIHRHRKAGHPVQANGATSTTAPTYENSYPSTNNGGQDYEKGNSVPMQSIPPPNHEYYAQQPAPPYPHPQQNKTQMPAEPQMDQSQSQPQSQVISPVSSGYRSEMGMGSQGEMHEVPAQRY